MPSTPDQFLELILKRRMVRAFTNAPVDDDDLESIVRSAHCGPSAGNTRSLELLVLRSEAVGLYWDTTLPDGRREAFPWPKLLDAPVLLIPYVDPAAYVQRYGEADKAHTGLGAGQEHWSVPYWWVDGGAAVENVLLAIEACGLGGCLFGQFDHEPAVRARFGVPDGRRTIGTIAIGHPDFDADRPSQSSKRPRQPVDAVTHHNHWQHL